MSTKKIEIGIFWPVVIISTVLCWGSPDIIDGAVFKATGVKVWECKDNQCVPPRETNQEPEVIP